MNITKVAAWSEIVSSVAILATLVYLALQMQQNTAAIRAQTHQAMIEVDLQLIAKPEANPDTLLARFSEGELSPERKIRLNANLLSALRSREFMWFQYQNGVLEEKSWRSYQKKPYPGFGWAPNGPVLGGTKWVAGHTTPVSSKW